MGEQQDILVKRRYLNKIIKTRQYYSHTIALVIKSQNTPFQKSIENIKMMIRAPVIIDVVTGNDYAAGLLREKSVSTG